MASAIDLPSLDAIRTALATAEIDLQVARADHERLEIGAALTWMTVGTCSYDAIFEHDEVLRYCESTARGLRAMLAIALRES